MVIGFIKSLFYRKLNKPFSQPLLRGQLLQFPNILNNPALDSFQFVNLFSYAEEPKPGHHTPDAILQMLSTKE